MSNGRGTRIGASNASTTCGWYRDRGREMDGTDRLEAAARDGWATMGQTVRWHWWLRVAWRRSVTEETALRHLEQLRTRLSGEAGAELLEVSKGRLLGHRSSPGHAQPPVPSHRLPHRGPAVPCGGLESVRAVHLPPSIPVPPTRRACIRRTNPGASAVTHPAVVAQPAGAFSAGS